MLIDWLKLAPALLLLLIPIGIFHGRQVRFRSVPANFGGYWGRTFALGLHTVDLGRAILGAWLLAEALSTLPDAKGGIRYEAVAVQAGVLFVAMLLQTFVCKEPDAANPPFAFAIGVVLGFLPPAVAGFALFVAVMAGLGFRSVGAFFPLLAFSVVGSGLLFVGQKILLTVGAVAIAMITPWLFTLLFPRHFAIAYAAKRTSGAPPEPAAR